MPPELCCRSSIPNRLSPRSYGMTCLPQTAWKATERPLYPKVAYYLDKVAPNYELLAFQETRSLRISGFEVSL